MGALREPVHLADEGIVRAIAATVAVHGTSRTFANTLRGLVLEDLASTLDRPGRPLSETELFSFSRPTFEASNTIFNLVAACNEFERDFAQFFQDATDVAVLAKLPRWFRFTIEYTDSATNLRYFEPDFVTILSQGVHYAIETKGQENIDVAHKDWAATIWCENAMFLNATKCVHFKVPQSEFVELRPSELSNAVLAFAVTP